MYQARRDPQHALELFERVLQARPLEAQSHRYPEKLVRVGADEVVELPMMMVPEAEFISFKIKFFNMFFKL